MNTSPCLLLRSKELIDFPRRDLSVNQEGTTMMPDPLSYQLLLVGLVWLCLMLHVVWPSDRATAGSTTPRPATAPPKRSSDLKPFPGLTRRPPCAACEQAHEHVPQP